MILSGKQESEGCWCVELVAPAAAVPAFACALEQVGEAVLIFAVTADHSDHGLWRLSTLSRDLPNRAVLTALLAVTAAATGMVVEPAFTITRVEACDWAAHNLATFPPLTVGRFYIYGGHVAISPPVATIPLLVEATAAFGSGEHPSTQGCLLALERLARKLNFQRCLDIGCGTGILSLAAAKLWHTPVCAVDIEPSAVRVTAYNARRNGVHRLLRTLKSDGLTMAAAICRRPVDLILANILARPLARMARDVARTLQPGGRVVLSGLLIRQQQMILAIYRAHGLTLEQRILLFPWLTLILRKPT
ncbi:Ribosomal protein L11 methyltransferase [invertebrate metagenome]|uniref:Ribosomal protein L11 methyltransferase n=1 Tax=invertebrate metagenome TaxID=1711999 RepID=A0A484H5E2_9ZZZZ